MIGERLLLTSMRFTTPIALLLLLVLPYFLWIARAQLTGFRASRERAALLLRLAIMLLLVLSLAGAQAVRAGDELAVIFLLDVSDSISVAEKAAGERYIREAMAEMGPRDRAGVILFGANALVERPVGPLSELAPLASEPQPLQSDLAEAVRLGLALFPPGSARRLVVLSDGAATTGDALEAARLAAESEVQIDFVALGEALPEFEARVVAVDAPTRAVQGETIVVEVTVESNTAMPAVLRVLDGGQVLDEAQVDLRVGSNNFSLPLQASEQAFARYTVQIEPLEDSYYQNNSLAAYTEIVGPPQILLVAAEPDADEAGTEMVDDAIALRVALEEVGLPVDTVTPATLPAAVAPLSSYAGVVLVNVNAKDLSPRKMETLQSYVRDLGGGLVVVGGPQSYGVGGYYRTALEETLPVEMQIQDQERFPAVSIALVIDRSGSMAAPEGGVAKIALASEAAVRVVELLNDFDEITVIPVDTAPREVVGPVSAANKAPVIAQLRRIGAGGGGINVRTGVEVAADALIGSENPVRHIIVLADGSDANEQGGVPALIEALVAEGVTVSMVAIGDGQHVPWLRQMAQLGGGRFHLTDQAANLPQIFTQETAAIQRSYLVEERFFPTLAAPSPILSGIDAVPPLYGYVATSPRPTAQVILETPLGDPLLAAWQYGLGRAVVWTSDATGRWAREWVRWEAFPTFWAQAVRWTITQNRDSNVETEVHYSGERAILSVDARNDSGRFLNEMEMEASVVGPDGEALAVTLRQVAPGRYRGAFVPQTPGAYLLRIQGEETGAGESMVAQTTGWVLGYSPEYRRLEANRPLLEAMADLTGGRDLSAATPAAAFDHSLPAEPATRPLWPWLSLLAVLLLPLDVAARRLVLTRRDLERAWAAIPLPWRATRGAEEQPAPERVARLFAAKERAAARREGHVAAQGRERMGQAEAAGEREQGAAPVPTGVTDRPAAETLSEVELPTESDGRDDTPPVEPDSLAGRLLARRQAQETRSQRQRESQEED